MHRVFNPSSNSAFLHSQSTFIRPKFARTIMSFNKPNEVVIVSAARTPVGSFNGALKSQSAIQLGTTAAKKAMSDIQLDPKLVEEVYFGNVISAGLGQSPARQVAIAAGCGDSTEATTINKVCASGMKSIMLAAQSLQLGHRSIMMAGGMESMSNTPLLMPRTNPGFGHVQATDSLLNDGLWDVYNKFHMGLCAENTAKKYNLTREDADAHAIESYRRAERAWASGAFDAEIAPVTIKDKKGETIVKEDEEYKSVKYEKIPTLRPAFQPNGGIVTAANASNLNDGGSAMVLMTAEKAQELGLKPLAKIISYADAAIAPIDFPTAPTVAMPLALQKAGLKAEDISLWEINEAFSVVIRATEQILGIPGDKINVNGGAVALGHAIGNSGCRIVVSLVHALKAGQYGAAGICNGTREGLEDATLRNIAAINELSETIRTSFGPNGRNKLVINHLGKLFVTSDAATIIREIEVVHPAAKLLVMASQAQEAEMGDASNLVLIFAGALLKHAESILVMGLHPSEVIQGYELACTKALAELEKLSTSSLAKPLSLGSLTAALKPAIASKQYGSEDILAPLVAEAALSIMPSNIAHFNVDNVRVVKIMGGSLSGSKVVRGMVFGREPEGVVKNVTKAKVVVYSCGLDITQTETKGTVLLKNAEEMLNFTTGEEKQTAKIFQEIADSGVKVIVAGAGVGELALHYLDRLGIAVIKVLSKFDLRRLCRVVGATPLARLGAPTPEEAGTVDVLECIEIGGDRVTVFRQEETGGSGEKSRTATIVLRGATSNLLDDLERAVDDGVNVIKALVKDPRLVAGAGATELELARRVETYGAGLKGLNQHAVKKFALALEVVPSTLSENAGLDTTEVISRLYAKHEKDSGKTWGVDIENETDGTMDVSPAQIHDSLSAKAWAIRLATEAAVTVLRVDSIIMSKPAGGPKVPQQAGNWDED
ncbi:T-complex protein 1 subunit theta [Tulasnella sp. 330]|nr:T-complex protein 1 subunit theta [Tulasnella sp. 330]